MRCEPASGHGACLLRLGAVRAREAARSRIRDAVESSNGTPYVYRRAFHVGPGIDPNRISAELKHGVLRVTARKSDALKPRQIKVKAA